MFIEIHNWCKWLDCNMGELAMNCMFLMYSFRSKIEQSDTYNIMG